MSEIQSPRMLINTLGEAEMDGAAGNEDFLAERSAISTSRKRERNRPIVNVNLLIVEQELSGNAILL